MTQTLTTERMAEIAKLAIRLHQISGCAAVTSSGETIMHHTFVDTILSALNDVTSELLANREAQPVMYASEETLAYAKEGEKSLIVWSEPMGDAVVPLFTVATAQASGVVNLPTEFISDEGVVVRLEQVMAALALVGVKYERRGGACRAAMLKAESKPCNRCHGEEWVIDEMGITPCICRRDGNATLTNEGTIAQPQNEPQIIPNNIPDGCEWAYDDQDCKWDSGCGDAWMFCDGGPAENGVKFCQCCGKPVVLAAAPDRN